MKYRAGKVEFSELYGACRYSELINVKVEYYSNGEWKVLSNLYY